MTAEDFPLVYYIPKSPMNPLLRPKRSDQPPRNGLVCMLASCHTTCTTSKGSQRNHYRNPPPKSLSALSQLVMTQFQNENNAVSCARSKDLLQEIWGKSSSAGTIITLMLWILRITYCPTRFRSRIFIKSFIPLMVLSSWSFQPSSTCPWMEAFLSLDESRFSRFEDFLILMFPPPTFYEHSTFLCPAIKYQTCQLSNSVERKTIKPWVWDKRTSIEARSILHTTHSLSRRCLIYLCC